MKIIFVAAALGAAALATGALAASPGDEASGSGTAGPCIVEGPLAGFCGFAERDFKLSGRASSSGDVHGVYKDRTASGARFHGKVTCLEVDGNRAVLGGTLVGDSSVSGLRFNVYVADNGPPGSANPDLISPIVIDFDSDPAFVLCDSTTSAAGYLAVVDGDVTVTDGTV